MRLLILSFYFPPDLGAGSFRTQALLEALLPYRERGLEIDVVTTMPNRYHAVKEAASATESAVGLSVRRVSLPTHQSGVLDQSRAFASYAKEVLKITSGGAYDAVFATSSRLLTAALASWIGRKMRIPVYLDIRDLFTDTIEDIFPGSAMSARMFRFLERWSFNSAARINIVSEGFKETLRNVAPNVELRGFSNGIDKEFLDTDYTSLKVSGTKSLIVYAGNIGEGQGLHHVLPAAAQALSSRARFRIIGAGGRAAQLSNALSDIDTDVEFLPPMPRRRLIEQYREADILLVHLNNHSAFEKVLPSKIFEYGATGKPILAGLRGHSARFMEANLRKGVAVFSPCDVGGLVNGFETLSLGPPTIDRSAFRDSFNRENIMAEMAADIMQFLSKHAKARGSSFGTK